LSEQENEYFNILGLKLRRDFDLGDLIHLIFIMAAVIGLAMAGEQWKTTVELQMQQVTEVEKAQHFRVQALETDFEMIDERLSRMEGKIDSIDRAVK